MTNDELLAVVTNLYLSGRDFNGYPVRNLGLTREDVEALLVPLIEEELISANFGTYHPNPYVKAFPADPVADQLDRLADLEDLTHLTIYPEAKHLEAVVNRDDYAGRPYTLRLALGGAELVPAFFDLSVLEAYRNDPRYYYETDDTSGRISVTNEFYETEAMKEADQVVLQTFGYGYDDNQLRAVCVFTVYLGRLTPEHQQIWAAKELDAGYRLHPAYRSSAILGEFPDKVSIFEAFTEELAQLQQMSETAGLPPIVRRSFKDSAKPTNFSFLIRPTLKELQDFHSTLDKLMSGNLNQDFFKESGICLEREVGRKDGRVEVQRKGTITLLEEWADRIRFPDPGPKGEMITTFKKVRELRQRPAHAADDNNFDQRYFAEQRDLVIEAYAAIRTLRMILANHPALAEYAGVPDWLYEGEIYTY
jgi:hypothetical protein